MRRRFSLVAALLSAPFICCAQQPGDPEPGTRTQNALWSRIKASLQAPDGMDYFRTSLQDAFIPKLNGTVISREPGILRIAMSDAATPDVQLKLSDEEATVLVPILPEGSRSSPEARVKSSGDAEVEAMIHDWREHGLHTGWLKVLWVQRPAPQSAREADPPVGALIEFEGSATDFTPAPFTLTFTVKRSDIRIVESKK